MANEYSDPDLNDESCLALGIQTKAWLLSGHVFLMKVAKQFFLSFCFHYV